LAAMIRSMSSGLTITGILYLLSTDAHGWTG
jgi:hypothetical protein